MTYIFFSPKLRGGQSYLFTVRFFFLNKREYSGADWLDLLVSKLKDILFHCYVHWGHDWVTIEISERDLPQQMASYLPFKNMILDQGLGSQSQNARERFQSFFLSVFNPSLEADRATASSRLQLRH